MTEENSGGAGGMDPERKRFVRDVLGIASRENVFRPVADALWRLYSVLRERWFNEAQAMTLTVVFFEKELGAGRRRKGDDKR